MLPVKVTNTNNRHACSNQYTKKGEEEAKYQTNVSKVAFLHQVNFLLAGAAVCQVARLAPDVEVVVVCANLAYVIVLSL